MRYDKFKVITDTSVWPLVENLDEVSAFAPGEIFYATLPANLSSTVLTVNIFAGQNVAVHNRKIRKIDDLLSYLGGLLGLIILFASFLLNKYNLYRY